MLNFFVANRNSEYYVTDGIGYESKQTPIREAAEKLALYYNENGVNMRFYDAMKGPSIECFEKEIFDIS